MIPDVVSVTQLLVVCDFDGTLAPIVNDPDDARAVPRAIDALHTLAQHRNTRVAIVSGRRRAELVDRMGGRGFTLIGEHGADYGSEVLDEPPALVLARQLVNDLVEETPGARVEHKAHSVVFHYRQVDDPDEAVDSVRRAAEHLEGIHVVEGKKVVELTVSTETKGDAVERLRQHTDSDAVVYLGDDTTDETVFEMLRPGDFGVKVGPGPTAAAHRLDGPEAVADFLEELAEARERS